jgi:hypothetical protein
MSYGDHDTSFCFILLANFVQCGPTSICAREAADGFPRVPLVPSRLWTKEG